MRNVMAICFIALYIAVSSGTSGAAPWRRYNAYNYYGLEVCKFVEMNDSTGLVGSVIVVTYDCVNDEMESARYLTVDRRFNTGEVDETIAAVAAESIDPTVDFFATIGRLYFFKSLLPAELDLEAGLDW